MSDFWKEQPRNVSDGAFRTLWTGGDFCIIDVATNTVILRIRASDAKVLAALPNGSITADMLATDSVTTAKIADSNVTTAKIANLNVTEGKLAADSVTVTKLAGIGFSKDYASTSAGADNLLAAAVGARYVLLTVQVLEAFANNAGAQPTFTIGDTTNATRFLAAAELTGAVLGTKIACGGIITTNEPLVVTATAATNNATGAIRVTAIAVQ